VQPSDVLAAAGGVEPSTRSPAAPAAFVSAVSDILHVSRNERAWIGDFAEEVPLMAWHLVQTEPEAVDATSVADEIASSIQLAFATQPDHLKDRRPELWARYVVLRRFGLRPAAPPESEWQIPGLD